MSDVDNIASEPGVIPEGDGSELFNDRTSWAYQALLLLNNRGILPGWDMRNIVTWAHAANGKVSVNGDFGPLFGEGQRRLSLIASWQRLQNLEISVGYNFFLGDPRKGIRRSIVKQNPLSDRDYASVTVKYNF